MVHALADPERVKIDGYTTREIPAEQLTEVSIALSDLFTLLDAVGPLRLTLDDTFEIATTQPLSEIPDLQSRVRGSLISSHWICDYDLSRKPRVMTVQAL